MAGTPRPDRGFVFLPQNTKDILKKLYFSSKIRVILTSATLTSAVGGPLENQYAYFLHNTGFPVGRTGILSEPHPSPYPYDEHAMIYFCDDLPHPTRDHEAFIEKGVERLIQVLNISQGKALVLFTAKTDMEEVYAALQSRNLPYKILIQQNGASQERVLQAFRNDVNSVLLGTGAYWEGISIEGKSLPILSSSACHSRYPILLLMYKASIAKDAMMDVRVPEMIIKLKQGIGRLIRQFQRSPGSCPSSTAVSGTPSRSDTTILLGTRCLSIAAPLISKRSKPFIIRYAIEAGLQSFVFAPNERKNSAGTCSDPRAIPIYDSGISISNAARISSSSRQPATSGSRLAYAVRSIR